MRKIKVLDKDMNMKGYIENLDWEVNFSVTENGFWPLDFTVVGDADIEHSDLVKVIDDDGQTIEEVTKNNTYLRFDWTDDYVQTWTSIIQRPRSRTDTGLSFGIDWYGDYLTNFWWSSPAFRYLDVWGTFDEIQQGKSFSIKFAMDMNAISGVLFQHNDFIIRVDSGDIRIWWIGGVGVSFTPSTWYIRFVIVWNGTSFEAYQNSTLITWTDAPTGTVRPYSIIWRDAWWGSSVAVDNRWYLLCAWNRVLTAWEITAENASHAVVTTSNRFFSINPSWIAPIDPVVTSWDVSWDLTASTNIAISWWFRLRADGVDNVTSQTVVITPYIYMQVRSSVNNIQFRYDNAGARISNYILWNWDRQRHHFVGVAQDNGTTRQTRLRVDGILRDSDDHAVSPSVKYLDEIELWRRITTYYNWDIKDIRIHTYTGALSDADALRLYQWIDPQDTTDIVEYARYDMNEWSGDILSGTATRFGATWLTQNNAPFAKLYNKVVEQEIYYGQVVKITPTLQASSGKRTVVNCLGIQTTLNDRVFKWQTGATTWDELLYPYQILQYVYDQMEYKYLDYIGKDYLEYPDYLRDIRRQRYWMYIIPWLEVTDPFGNQTPLLSRTSWSGNIELITSQPITPDTVAYIWSVWLRTDSWTKTVTMSYGTFAEPFFLIRTYTIDTVWRRYSIRFSRSPWGGWLRWRMQINGNVYISTPKLYRWSETNIKQVWDVLDISFNKTKLITAFQDALKFGNVKIKRTTDMYPEAFTPDITNTPDHYLIEEKHLSFLEKGEYSDEIINSVQVEYDGGITSAIRDTTSIAEYREREWVIQAPELRDSSSATNYGNIFLSQNKDPKTYVKAVVTRDYPLHTLRVWDLCQINGNTLAIERGYITRLDMNDKQCTIYLDHYDGLGKSLSKIS